MSGLGAHVSTAEIFSARDSSVPLALVFLCGVVILFLASRALCVYLRAMFHG